MRSSKIKVEKVPLPPALGLRSPYTAAFMAMKPGESLVADGAGRSAIMQYAWRKGIPAAQRRVGKGRFRVWRMENK